MIIEQTVIIPDDYRISLELPRSVPTGVKAQISIAIPTVFENQKTNVIHCFVFTGKCLFSC